jgi:hypothetical protein
MGTIDRVSGGFLVLFALGVIWEAHKLPLGTLHSPGPGFMPMLLAIVLGGFGIIIGVAGGASVAFRALRWGEGRHALAILGACAFAALVLERFGYRLTTLLVAGLLLGLVERRRPLVVAALSLGLSVGSFYLFAHLLKVPLPRGAWGF